ncbi:thioredoxin domain-containing protein [Erythrobacter sp. GH1-10]|uniref:thioredoxin domain-containing protein n=1 Tax=Erythrobacter sp. GH1-10 TaxID=3349334 RepID=UPI003877F988
MISIRSVSTKRAMAIGAIAPLALALSACDSAPEEGGAPAGEPIEAIPAPDGTSWTETVNISEEGGYVLGNPDAPLKLVEYASHTCSACAYFAQTGSTPLKEDYVSTGVVSYELRNLIANPVDLTIATLVRCGQPESMQVLADQAWVQFEEVMGGVSANAEAINATGDLPLEERFVQIGEVSGLIDFFSARGLSADQARQCLADVPNIEGIAERSQQQGQELNLTGTPSWLLNGRKLEVNQWADLEPVLQRAGARTE